MSDDPYVGWHPAGFRVRRSEVDQVSDTDQPWAEWADWTAERISREGRRLSLDGPLSTAEMLDLLSSWLHAPEVGGVVVYRTPRNRS